VVQLVVDMHTGELFRAALALWVASAAEPQLRERVVILETRIGRQVHRATVQLLCVDEHQAGVRPLIQGILDMARGLGLANLLGDDRQRSSSSGRLYSTARSNTALIEMNATLRTAGRDPCHSEHLCTEWFLQLQFYSFSNPPRQDRR
jgi:hypothetical protein